MNVPTEIVYAKIASMVAGAAIADEMAKKEAKEAMEADGEPATTKKRRKE